MVLHVTAPATRNAAALPRQPTQTAQPTGTAAPIATPTPVPTQDHAPRIAPDAPIGFSILEGNLDAAYPLTATDDGFILHYQPAAFSAGNVDEIAAFVSAARYHINTTLGVNFDQPFDVYLAGSLFAPPNQALRGRAFSAQRSVFVLYDGSGTPAERHYMLAHELTHMIAWNTYGQPSSTMLSEGAAVAAGEVFLRQEPFIPLQQVCLAYRRAGSLPSVAAPGAQFNGHLYSLDAYYASGCFTQYLIAAYGNQKFGEVYPTSDYQRVYGKSLRDIEEEWLAQLDANQEPLSESASEIPAAYARVVERYKAFFNRLTVSTFDWQAYFDLDRERLDILRGKAARATTALPTQACQQPPDDYTRTTLNGHVINQRTLWMLQLADALYEGRGDPLRVVQGSYTDTVASSFGTHAGGGAVDISVRAKAAPNAVLSTAEAVTMVLALRRAGFAAWLRLPDDLSPPSPLHIHAIAVGDRELSPSARQQLDGPEGYFRGMDGVPPAFGGPKPDRYGGPVICQWMRDLGYDDLR